MIPPDDNPAAYLRASFDTLMRSYKKFVFDEFYKRDPFSNLPKTRPAETGDTKKTDPLQNYTSLNDTGRKALAHLRMLYKLICEMEKKAGLTPGPPPDYKQTESFTAAADEYANHKNNQGGDANA